MVTPTHRGSPSLFGLLSFVVLYIHSLLHIDPRRIRGADRVCLRLKLTKTAVKRRALFEFSFVYVQCQQKICTCQRRYGGGVFCKIIN